MEKTNDEDIYGRRKLMKKIRAIAVAMAMTVFLSGCYDYGRDITIICPVINYMACGGEEEEWVSLVEEARKMKI